MVIRIYLTGSPYTPDIAVLKKLKDLKHIDNRKHITIVAFSRTAIASISCIFIIKREDKVNNYKLWVYYKILSKIQKI